MHAQLKQLIETTVEGLGYIHWGSEYRPQSQSALLRIFIEKEEGITVDDCAKVSQQIGAVLDVENLIPVAYILEVSSPGIDRVLFEVTQYQAYLGKTIKIRTRTAIAERRNFKGTMKQASEEAVTITVDGDDYTIPYDQIDRAKLVMNQI